MKAHLPQFWCFSAQDGFASLSECIFCSHSSFTAHLRPKMCTALSFGCSFLHCFLTPSLIALILYYFSAQSWWDLQDWWFFYETEEERGSADQPSVGCLGLNLLFYLRFLWTVLVYRYNMATASTHLENTCVFPLQNQFYQHVLALDVPRHLFCFAGYNVHTFLSSCKPNMERWWSYFLERFKLYNADSSMECVWIWAFTTSGEYLSDIAGWGRYSDKKISLLGMERLGNKG